MLLQLSQDPSNKDKSNKLQAALPTVEPSFNPDMVKFRLKTILFKQSLKRRKSEMKESRKIKGELSILDKLRELNQIMVQRKFFKTRFYLLQEADR